MAALGVGCLPPPGTFCLQRTVSLLESPARHRVCAARVRRPGQQACRFCPGTRSSRVRRDSLLEKASYVLFLWEESQALLRWPGCGR